MDEILTTVRDLELEVNEDDTEELIMGYEDELTIEELQEILNEEHQETQRNVSPSEHEEDERGPMPTHLPLTEVTKKKKKKKAPNICNLPSQIYEDNPLNWEGYGIDQDWLLLQAVKLTVALGLSAARGDKDLHHGDMWPSRRDWKKEGGKVPPVPSFSKTSDLSPLLL
ncbi:uncharacterized protein TNCV_329691 [Trichonephila clavipes]|nr:uncharacterized protein TNCV_329691 [Trichonephila clavipes]